MSRWGLALFLCACACGGEEPVVLDVALLAGDGTDPLATFDAERVRIEVQQQGEEPTVYDEMLGEEGLDHGIAFRSWSANTEIRVAFEGPGGTLLGAPPRFIPSAAGGRLNIAVTQRQACTPVESLKLEGFEAISAAQVDSFVLLSDGTGRVRFLDLLRLEAGELEDLSLRQPGRFVRVSDSRAAWVGEDSGILYDLAVSMGREANLDLHEGVGSESGFGAHATGAVVVGGSSSAASGVSWIGEDGSIIRTTLRTPRQSPRVFVLRNETGLGALVIGGQAEEEMLAEWIRPGATEGQPVALPPNSSSLGLVEATGDSVLLYADGGLYRIRCETECVSERIREAEPPTISFAVYIQRDSELFEVDSDGRERRVFSLEGEVALAGFATRSGVSFWVQREGADTVARVCVPDALRPIVF